MEIENSSLEYFSLENILSHSSNLTEIFAAFLAKGLRSARYKCIKDRGKTLNPSLALREQFKKKPTPRRETSKDTHLYERVFLPRSIDRSNERQRECRQITNFHRHTESERFD